MCITDRGSIFGKFAQKLPSDWHQGMLFEKNKNSNVEGRSETAEFLNAIIIIDSE